MPTNVRSARALAAAERRAEVVRLRRNRLSFAEIARELGLSESGAWRAYKKALAMVPAPEVEQHRQEEVLICDDAVRDLFAIARDPAVSMRYRVEAFSVARSWGERKDRLLGLNAPTQRSVAVTENRLIQAEIRRLEVEIVQAQAELDAEGAGGPAPRAGHEWRALPPGPDIEDGEDDAA